MWVLVDELLRDLAGTVEDGIVAHQIGNMQVERNPTLLRTLQISRAAQLQVRFGNPKPSLLSVMISIRLRVSADSS